MTEEQLKVGLKIRLVNDEFLVKGERYYANSKKNEIGTVLSLRTTKYSGFTRITIRKNDGSMKYWFLENCEIPNNNEIDI